MSYIPNTDEDRLLMLEKIGVRSFDELIKNIPEKIRINNGKGLNLPPALSEWEMVKDLNRLASKNIHADSHVCFIGGGAYDHFIPSAVDSIVSRPEFYTAYTPYQAELSQGTLQVIYEFQTCVCELSGMEVANASMYDGASALAEAILMAYNLNHKSQVLVPRSVHPNYIDVVKTYIKGQPIEIISIEIKDNAIDFEDLRKKINENISSVVVQQPNFFGNIEDVFRLNDFMKSFPDCKYIVSFDPISLGFLEAPGNYGADIAVAEGQGLGVPLSLGGPYVGLFATKNEYIRKMPGRLSGKTVDVNGKEGYTLTLQTREQHIKRDKATSNICTNQGLMALAATVYMALMGKQGIQEAAKLSMNKAHYLAEKINSLDGYSVNLNQPFFKEFVVQTKKDIDKILQTLLENKILGGINLKRFGFEGLLVAVTEKRSKDELDAYADVLKGIE